MNDRYTRYLELSELDRRGVISKSEYRTMLEMEGRDPQLIDEMVAFRFDAPTGDVVEVNDEEEQKS